MPSRISQMRSGQQMPQQNQQFQINDAYIDQLKTLMNSKNAPQYLAQLAAKNPQFQQIIQMAQNGGNLQAIFENMARQRGVNPNEILQKLIT